MFAGFSDEVLVGEGGLGRVFRATRTSTGGVVAIKELRDVAEGSSAWHRAQRELEALLRLKGHPFVVSVEEIIDGPLGPCLVMEYMPGGSLADRVESTGPLPSGELVFVGQCVAQALAAAHHVGVIHRDIKPHNVLVGGFGQVKVCDFGISALTRDGGHRTQTAALTLAYASPEELDGDESVGPPADAYSLSATMLYLLTGVRPSFRDRLVGVPTVPPGVDPVIEDLVRLVLTGLEHDPADRPTMPELHRAFDAAAADLGARRCSSLDASTGPREPALARSVRVALDGTGDTADLANAIDGAGTSTVVKLAPGTHRISDTLDLAGHVQVIGSGVERTRIVASAVSAGVLVRHSGAGRLILSDVSLVYEGQQPADVLIVDGGDVELSNCAFRGGTAGPGRGAGVRSLAGTTLTVRGCEARDNALAGFLFLAGTTATVSSSASTGNQHGFMWVGDASGSAEGNVAAGNRGNGFVIDSSNPVSLVNNSSSANGASGYGWFGVSTGEARGNEAANNGLHGFVADTRAAPVLVANSSWGNADSGFAFLPTARGHASDNVSSSNRGWGFFVGEGALPNGSNNVASGNGSDVIHPSIGRPR